MAKREQARHPAEPPTHTPTIKRSIAIAGHRTSISVEQPFWDALKEIAAAEGKSVSALLAELDRTRAPEAGLSSSVRLFVLDWFRRRAGSAV
jgi:predicted DNA-binding ribbon-helix-helix protein